MLNGKNAAHPKAVAAESLDTREAAKASGGKEGDRRKR
jgi:hypothetical protein